MRIEARKQTTGDNSSIQSSHERESGAVSGGCVVTPEKFMVRVVVLS